MMAPHPSPHKSLICTWEPVGAHMSSSEGYDWFHATELGSTFGSSRTCGGVARETRACRAVT